MTTALAVNSEQTFWDDKQIAALKQIGLEGAPQAELAVFLHQCQRTGLDPFARQIYMISRGGKWTIQSSIDGLRIIAQRSGEYAGQTAPMWCGADGVWQDVWLAPTPPTAAKIGVYRAGFAEPLYAVARLDSYMPKTREGKPMGLWATMPDVMLAKVAESLALRKAFPNDLSGLYTTEEMSQATPEPVATVLLTEDELLAIAKNVQAAKTKADLRTIWAANTAHLDQIWTNSLGEQVSLKSLIVSRQAEVPESEAN